MITGDIKNKVDRLWDTFWEKSNIRTPVEVVSHLSYLFFMKMLDDAQTKEEATAGLFGGKLKNPTFPEGLWTHPDSTDEHPIKVPYNSLRWKVFKEMSAENMFDMVRNNVFPFIKEIGHGKETAYTRFMKDAIFLINKPRVLESLVQQVDGLDMNNRDTMGDVYEYILGKMAEKGQNGQFRTPRHIIRMMVEMMKPSLEKNDAICDPAMGSAGFLVEAAHYIAEHEKALMVNTEKLNYYQSKMFTGFDTDTTMLRIGSMNMLLHKIDDPNIQEQDSLSTDNPDIEQYSMILANPPFTGKLDKEVVSPTLTNLTKTNKTELLFLALFIRSLIPGGRCASIVPDGVLFGGSSAHVAIRKNLVDNQRLEAVISMPSGVFKPYSGVSTAILIFTKTGDGGTDKVWFYDMKSDGFSLDDKRDPIEENDIPDVVGRWNNLAAEESRSRKEQSFFVPVKEIRDNGYDLSVNKYKEVEHVKIKYEAPEVIMNRVMARQVEITEKLQIIKDVLKNE